MQEVGGFPAGLESHPRASLAHLPTPLEATPNLGEALGIELHVKRDDCTGLGFGGNKVRQLEYYLGEAQAQGADTVLITGAVQSNFVRACAAAARRLGMEPHVQLEQRVPSDDAEYRASGNVLLDRLLEAHIHTFPAGEDEAAADRSLEAIAAALEVAGRRPYVVHLGIEHPPVGALGYVRAGLELAAQMREHALDPDVVVVPSGSGLTHAGLLVGLRISGVEARVHGVCVRRDAGAQRARIERRAREVAALVGEPDAIAETDIDVSDAALAPGYGRLSETTFEAIALAARSEGLLLDPVYSGKTLAGLAALVRSRPGASIGSALFLHTGGEPALFGYRSALEPYLGER